MKIEIDKLMMEDMVREVEISDGNTWLSDPINIGSNDYFLEVKTNGSEVTIKVTQTNLKGLEIEVISITEDL
jgi:hypothetical protein